VSCAAYVLLWVCELYLFDYGQFLELLRSELLFLYLKKAWIQKKSKRGN
jgi:hypothetical protein